MSSTTFAAARDTAYNMGWSVMSEANPDTELSDSDTLKKLRLRSRQLIKDNTIVAGAQQAYINMVFNGGPVVKSTSENRIQRTQINDLLLDICKSADMTGLCSFSAVLEQIIAWSFADGDILINLPMDKKADGVKTRVELIEAFRIRTPDEFTYKASKNDLVRHGVEYDTEGRVKGYWVKKAENVDSYSDRKEYFNFYPAYREVDGFRRKVTYLFKAPLNARPNMSRGYPVITPAITLLKHFDSYLEAVVVGARVAACFSAFITTKNPVGTFKGFTTDATGTILDPQDSNQQRRVQKLAPGQVFYLKPEEEINFAAPNRPGDNADAFIERILKLVASYLRVPYPILFLDLSEVNYSSWRGGTLETIKMINRWRNRLDEVIDWIVGTWVLEGMSLGLVRGSFDSISIIKRWKTSGILDPEKEARANKIRLTMGIASKRMIAEEQGLDYEEVQAEIYEEQREDTEQQAEILKLKKEKEKEFGVTFPDTVQEGDTNRDTSKSRRVGEQQGEDLDEDDARDRRKDDGNW